MDEKKEAAITAFLEDFVAAFASFSGDRVADKFTLPYLAKGPGDSCQVFDSRSQLGAYFQSYLDYYRSQGCCECRYSSPAVTWLGAECALASFTWNLVDASGSSVMSWSESYMLSFVGDKTLAFATVDHVDG